jgi:hypothetical protein
VPGEGKVGALIRVVCPDIRGLVENPVGAFHTIFKGAGERFARIV